MEHIENGAAEQQRLIITEQEAGQRADVGLAAMLELTRSNMQKLLEEGRAVRGSKVLKSNYKLRLGDEIDVTLPEPQPLDVQPENIPLDIGSFNGRKFSYVASFGAFTQASYATPQSVKNMLGHLAYILEGVTSMTSIKPEHMIIETEDNVYEDDYIFGAVSNSTSLAGILTLDPEYVDMGDGLFELLLVKSPKNLIDLTEIVHMLTTQNYDSGMLTFVNSDRFRVHASEDTPWSLDGEYQEGASEIFIENLHNAINLAINKKRKK